MSTQDRVTSAAVHPTGGETGGAPEVSGPRRTRAQIGKANNSKGKYSELLVAKYLRPNGFPGAERMVRTGYRSANRISQDCGDITGTPGIVWQVKYIAERSFHQIPQMLLDTEKQASAAGADIGILVVRRAGHGSPAQWWAHVWFGDLLRLVEARGRQDHPRTLRFPVRLELGELVPLLRMAGYGTPLDTEDTAPSTQASDICDSESRGRGEVTE